MKRTSGGQTSVGADAKLLSSHAGDPRAATGDTTDTSHTGRHIPAGGQPVMESARRRSEDLPARSDVTGPQPETLTQRPVIRDDRVEGATIVSRFPAAFPLPAFASWSSCARRGIGRPSRSAYRPEGLDPDGVSAFRTHELRPGWVPSLLRGQAVLTLTGVDHRPAPAASQRRVPAPRHNLHRCGALLDEASTKGSSN